MINLKNRILSRLKLNSYKLLLILFDALIINISLFFAFLIRFDLKIPQEYLKIYSISAIPTTIITLGTFFLFGLYHQIWIYASIEALLSIIYAVSIGAFFSFTLVFLTGGLRYPYTVIIIFWLLNLLLVGASRFLWRITRDSFSNNSHGSADIKKRVLIVGAGDAGESILREMLKYKNQYAPIGLVDDNPKKRGMHLHGVKIFGKIDLIPNLVVNRKIDEVIIAIPTASGSEMRRVVSLCKKAAVRFKTLPTIYEIMDGKVSISNIRDVNEEDLLNREPIKFDFDEIKPNIKNKTVLITGAGGSIGSELARQIAHCGPKNLILLGQGENSIFHIDLELKEKHSNLMITPIIANIRDSMRLEEIVDLYRPNIIFHSAAYKHVWLMEQNPNEAYKNNVLGTKNIAEAALKFDVDKFVLISTDKAVEPTSVMGKSKQEAEKIITNLNDRGATKFMITRFGNVMNSRGSVIPIFKRQIEKGNAVTVTHPDVVRYFMTIPEAVQLVIRAGLMGKGGEVFVLDMGEPIKIVDLAKELIQLSGFEPEKDIPIEFIGLKNGEKLEERLTEDDEELIDTIHKHIKMIKKPPPINYSQQQQLNG